MVTRRSPKPAQAPKKRAAAPKAPKARARTFWDDLADIGRSIPSKDLAFLPRDAAERFDEYFDAGAIKP